MYVAEAKDEITPSLNDVAIDQIEEPDIQFPGFLHPLCVSSVEEESASVGKEIAVAIHYPSWKSREEMKLHVGSNGNILRTDFVWSTVLVDLNLLHSFRLNGVNGQEKVNHITQLVWGFQIS